MEKKSNKQIIEGVVVSRSGDKTVAVAVTRVSRHHMYGKNSTMTKKYLAHDPLNKAEVGQKVKLAATRPMSARKRWIIVN